jgi:Cell Wall Hydrolase
VTKRADQGIRTVLRDVRGAFALALMALVSSCVMPVGASRAPAPDLVVALGAPTRFDPAAMLWSDPSVAPQNTPPAFSPTLLVPGPMAPTYPFRGRNAQDMFRASLCLTAAVYYEAGNEPEEGQRAVAQVILNRVRHPAYPDTVCGVVYQGTERGDNRCQFTFGCDGSMSRVPTPASWSRARRIAIEALAGAVYPPVGLSTHYHTLAVNPLWNRSLTPTAIVGAHIFFRWPGGAGAPRAFLASYRGGEPTPAPNFPVRINSADPAVLVDDQAIGMLPLSGREPLAVQPGSVAADDRYLPGALPESDVLPAYRNSGQWIAN